MNWEDLKYYLAVARTGSLSETARHLSVNPSTISRRIDSLEQHLGVKLFARRPDGYELTHSGKDLLSTAEQAEANLLLFERGATKTETELSGVVRIMLPELLGQYIVIPALTELQTRHPNIHLEMITDVRSSPLTKRNSDIVIRTNRPTNGDYTMQLIGQLSQQLYASQSYLERNGTPQTFSDLRLHNIIGWDNELSYLPLAQWQEERTTNQNMYLRTGSFNGQLIAATSGLGIVALPKFIAEQFQLKAVLPNESPLLSEIWLVQQTASKRLQRVNVVADFLKKIIQQQKHQLL